MTFFALTCVNVLLGMIIFFGSGQHNTLASIVLLSAFLLLSAMFSYIVVSKRMRVVSFMLIMFWNYGMMMPGLYQTRQGSFPWYQISVQHEMILPAALLCLLSVFMYIVGYFSHRTVFRMPEQEKRSVDPAGFYAATLVFLIAAAYSAYAISRLGILPFISTRQGGSLLLADSGLGTTGIGLLRTLPGALAISSFLIFAFDRYALGNRTHANLIMVLLSGSLMFIMNFPLSLPRFMMISILAVVGLTVLRRVFTARKTLIYFLSPLLIYLVFPYLGGFNRYDDVSWDFVVISPAESMLHGDFDGFQSIMNVLRLVETEGLSWGGRILSAMLVMVPRSVWGGKYNPTGADAAQVAEYDFLNISMPFPGELYADFGFLGVFAGMFLLGRLVAHLDFRTDATRSGRFSVEEAMIGIVLAAYMPILFRGALLAVIAPAFVSVLIICLWGVMRRLEWGAGRAPGSARRRRMG